MTVYEHKTSIQVAGGSNNTISLRVMGGIWGYIMVRPNTSTTLFRVNVQNDDNDVIRNYGFTRTEIMDDTVKIPVSGRYRITVTNASVADETFRILFSVSEGR